MSTKTFVHTWEVYTEWCPNCGYKNFNSFYSFLAYCPNCGNHLNHKYKVPHKTVFVTKTQNHYDLFPPKDTQFHYHFYNLPEELVSSYIIEEDIYIDNITPLEVAKEIQNMLNNYLYSNSKKDVDKVVTWLEEHEEEQEKMRLENKKAELEYELAKILHNINCLG